MAELTHFKASISEWRVALDALRFYKKHLLSVVGGIEDEERQNMVYDDLERIERMIPDFEKQLAKGGSDLPR